ncbi:hypothetical protein [Homoserinibacter sp. GY 40078]|uniref:hypothetical protein n=1 Tax=Homoserinibacter sp. GY 40078 TaxID=2603275 RepID=UPI0011CAEF1C|nr:hypothetical protein [Homoserinibacter sp. GY 40078]TXK17382.1 hypothetical protein FVQ89_11145 [Homoserinibacter sp. GY 40078]
MSTPDSGLPPTLVELDHGGREVLRVARPRKATRRVGRVVEAEVEPKKRRGARSGSGAAKSADNIAMHRLANLALVLGVVAGGVGSIDGLLHAAEMAFTPALSWVLPTALDVFLVGTAVATLALRERRAWAAVAFCVVVTLGLVGFSAVVNFTYWQSVTTPGTLPHEIGPFIKGAMPVLLLVALEILAAINTTKRRVLPTSVARLVAERDRLRGELRVSGTVAKLKARKKARG